MRKRPFRRRRRLVFTCPGCGAVGQLPGPCSDRCKEKVGQLTLDLGGAL